MSGVVYYPKPAILAKLAGARLAVIEASAGTGKTYTLEHLFVDMILTRDVRVEEILVVTFTEKATAELRARLRGKIQEILATKAKRDGSDEGAPPPNAWRIDDAARERLSRALGAFDAASVSTIHAFCQRALTENAFASGRLFQETSVDGHDAFDRAFRDALRELAHDENGSKAIRAALAAGMAIDGRESGSIAKTLYECASHRGEVRLGFDEAAARGAFATLARDLGAEGRARIEGELGAVKGMQARTRAKVLGNLDALAAIAHDLESVGDIFATLADLERRLDDTWSKARAHLLTYLDKPPAGTTSARVAAAIRTLAESSSLKGAIVHALLEPVTSRLHAKKRETGLIDFDDMLLLVRDALHGPQGARFVAALRARFTVALIDEFQDTDEIQWDIFRTLFFESPRHTLYLIGDPKQAIYGFRGGDVHTYIEAREAVVSAGGVRVPLAENHRSTPAVIDAYNRFLDDAASPSFFTSDEIRYDVPVAPGDPTLTAVGPDGEALTAAKVLHVGQGSGGIREVYAALAPRIATEIHSILNDSPAPLRFGGGRKNAPLARPRASDVFILTSRASEGYKVADALRRARVPYAFFKQEGLFQTDEAETLATLLAHLADPRDRSKRRKLWLSRFFEIALEDVARVDELPRTHPLPEALADFQALADANAYEELFATVLARTGLLRRTIFEGDERAITNYLHILEILLEEARRTSASVQELSRALDGYIAGRSLPEGESGNVQRLESEQEAVQIMTMHKSKGLEAAVVFVAGGFTQGSVGGFPRFHEGGSRVLLVGGGDDDAKERARRETVEEEQRLLYVALTRAKARLYLPMVGTPRDNVTASAGSGAKKSAAKAAGFTPKGAIAALNDRLHALSPSFAPHFDHEQVVVSRAPLDADDARAATARGLRTWAPRAALLEDDDAATVGEIDVLRARHGGFLVTSYTQMKRLTDASTGASASARAASAASADRDDRDAVRDADADSESDEGRARDDDGALPGGVGTGRFLHEVLESLDIAALAAAPSLEEWQSAPSVTALFEHRAARHEIDKRYLPAARAAVFAAFRGPIRLDGDTPMELAKATRHLREAEFLYPIPETRHPRLDALVRAQASARRELAIDRGVLKGFIDLLFEHEGRAYVLDWKSDLLPRYDAARLSSHVAEHYALQARIYTLALVKMLRITGEADFEARFGGIVYSFLRAVTTEPDESGQYRRGIYFSRPSWRDVLASEVDLIAHPAFGLPLDGATP